ncbi:MAG: hypothetical protein DDT22_01195 [candidate division WS2 bacterium]|nr:hypothetical protein [Candidatus Lithacetigena glycinireducens]
MKQNIPSKQVKQNIPSKQVEQNIPSKKLAHQSVRQSISLSESSDYSSGYSLGQSSILSSKKNRDRLLGVINGKKVYKSKDGFIYSDAVSF